MDNSLHEKLKAIENSLPEIEKQLSEIDISKDQKGYAEMAKKHSDVSIIVDLLVFLKDLVIFFISSTSLILERSFSS